MFRGGFGVPRGRWPMHIMLIIACCVIYVADSMLPATPVQASEWHIERGKEQVLEDLKRANVPITMLPQPAGPNGVGIVYAVPGQHAGTIAGQLDPIASAEYMLVSPLRAWFQFTTATAVFSITPTGSIDGWQVWRFVTYGFLHVGFMHLALNMLGLYMFAPIVEERFGRRKFLAIFLVSTMAGACLFLLLNAMGIAWMKSQGTPFALPGLLSNDPFVPLIGASGGVYGIILAAAWLRPNDEVLIMYIIPAKLKVLALVLIGVAVYTLLRQGANAGGEAAHLGGAIAGWWTAQNPRVLDDFFDYFRFLDRLPGARTTARTSVAPKRVVDDSVIDAILDKVRDKGLASLTERERDALRNATDAHRKRDGSGR